MKVDNLKINHITRPMGYWYRTLTASWKVKEALGKFQQSAQIQVSSDEDFKEIIWDSGRDKKLKSTGTEIPISLEVFAKFFVFASSKLISSITMNLFSSTLDVSADFRAALFSLLFILKE